MLVTAVKIYYLVFALLTAMGGVIGYVRVKSVASLVAGLISAALLVAASVLLPLRPEMASQHSGTAGFTVGITISVLLAGKFVPDFIHKKAIMPAGLMAVLSIGSIVLTLLAWHR